MEELKLKLQYFGHLMQTANSLENTLMLGKIEGMRRRGCLFIIGDWDAEAGSQNIPGVTSKFGLGVQNEAGKG